MKPPAKPAPNIPNSKIEENIDSNESAIHPMISVTISKIRPKLIVTIPETAKKPKNDTWANAIILIAFKEILAKNAAVAPKKNPTIPFTP